MTKQEREEKLAKIREHQMRIIELQKIEDPEERDAAYKALPPLDISAEEISEIYSFVDSEEL